jgi:hypothetical protein
MLRKLLFLLLLTVVSTYSQNGAHSTTSRVSRLFVSQDETKFLTLSGTEIVLWDNITNQMIWMKKLSDLGLGNEILHDPIVGVDPYLKYMAITNKISYRKLVNLTNFTTTAWPYYTYDFVNDGRIAVMDYDHSKKNSNTTYLLNINTGQKELIADKMGDLRVIGNGKFVRIINHDKSVNDYKYDKYKVYDMATKSFNKSDFDWRDLDNNFTSGEYKVTYSYGGKSITTTDANGNRIVNFTVKNPVSGSMESNKTHLFYVSETQPHAYFLEQDSNKPNEKLSYLYVYDITNGNVIKRVELHDTSTAAKLISESEITRQRQIEAENQRIFNLPENVLKRRLSNIQGNAYYNTNTKGIYYVVPDKPLYQGDLVRMDALNDDSKLKMEVYEKIENLENSSLYKKITSKSSCTHCNGKGFISNSYKRTVADYEYTTGKKLVETTTNTNSCGNCGGCGLVPNN